MTPGESELSELDPRATALLVVDVQNDVCHADGYVAPSGLGVTARADVVPRTGGVATIAPRHARVAGRFAS